MKLFKTMLRTAQEKEAQLERKNVTKNIFYTINIGANSSLLEYADTLTRKMKMIIIPTPTPLSSVSHYSSLSLSFTWLPCLSLPLGLPLSLQCPPRFGLPTYKNSPNTFTTLLVFSF